MFDSKEFGIQLKNARERKKIKQSDLAGKIGVSVQTISSYETGKKVPPLDNVVKICDVLGLSLDNIIGNPVDKGIQLNPCTLRDVVYMLDTVAQAMDVTPQVKIEDGTCWLWITDQRISDFYVKKEKMLGLLKDGTLNDDLFSSWYFGELEKLSKEEPLVLLGDLPF